MNSTKTKLFAAIAMLVVAAIAMTGTSFAWFTISTAPTVSSMNVSMAATRNFEIAWYADTIAEPEPGDETDYSKWGATVAFDNDNMVLNFPATTSGNALKTVNYGATGRVNDWVEVGTEGYTSGVALYTANIDSDDTREAKCAAAYAVALRSNVGGTVTVSVGAFDVVSITGGAVSDGIKNAARVALSVNGGAFQTVTSGGTTTFDIVANEKTKVELMVYFDGTNLYAADIVTGAKISGCAITFNHSKDMGQSTDGTTYAPAF